MRSEDGENFSVWGVWERLLEEVAFAKVLKGWLGSGHRNLTWWLSSKSVNKREVGRHGLNDSFWLEPRVSKGIKDKGGK